MLFQIIRNDIIRVKSDAIVNTANQGVTVGNGMDSAIYYAAVSQVEKGGPDCPRGRTSQGGAHSDE